MNFIELKNELPTGNQTFAALRQHGKVYVDKTSYVYAIATSTAYHEFFHFLLS